MQSETEGFVAVGLMRLAMEKRVCGGWAYEIDDGEKGLWMKKEEMERQ